MRISDFYKSGRPVVSFEVFPPKKDADIGVIYGALGLMAKCCPDFISVTYGAGGGGSRNLTTEIAAYIQENYKTASLAHMTCIGSEKGETARLLDEMEGSGVKNVLALRGDMPMGKTPGGDYSYAEDLIRDIRSRGGFCIGAACYPEGHIGCEDLDADIEYLRRKQDAGADFLITQLFFDNDCFYRFLARARGRGVTLPVSAGVMPILGRKQVERMIFMCGASLPSGIVKMLYKYEHSPADLRKAGIYYAAKQIENLLASGVDGVHIYTMNKPDIAEICMETCRKNVHG